MTRRAQSLVSVVVSGFAIAPLADTACAQFTFSAPIVSALPPGHTPIVVRLADLDADGSLDAVVPGRNWDGKPGTSGHVAVLHGVGDGTFTPWLEIPILEGNTDDAAIADVDGDGVLDITVTAWGVRGFLAVCHGLAEGGFAEAEFLEIERQPRGLASGDFDLDGHADFAAVNHYSASVSVVHGGATTSLAQRLRINPYSGGIPFPQQAVATDVDGDGDADVLVTSIGGGRVNVGRNLRVDEGPSAGFAPTVDWRPPRSGTEQPAITTMAVADFDLDGAPDVALPVLLVTQDQELIILRNDGAGGFAEKLVQDGTPLAYSWCAAAGDFDGDARPDVAVGTALSGWIVFFRNETPTPGASPVLSLQPIAIPYGLFVRDLTAQDIDGDGDVDVVGVEIAGGTVFTLLNEGGSGGVAGRAPRGAPMPLSPGDRNGDGEVDARDVALLLAAWPEGLPLASGIAGDETPPECGPGAGDCHAVHPEPGCIMTECCEIVCSVDPLCCEFGWDELCVKNADDLCDGIACPSDGACDVPHLNPGCSDEDCCNLICDVDSWCCNTSWDATCAEEAAILCASPACAIEIPDDAVPEDEPCYEHLNDGCAVAMGEFVSIECGALRAGKYATGGPRDTDWYRFTVDRPTRVHVELHAEFPSQLLLATVACEGPMSAIAQSNAAPCDVAVIETCLEPGEYSAFVSGGVPARVFRTAFTCDEIDPDSPPDPKDPPPPPSPYGLRYVMALSCEGCAPSADLDGNGSVGAADLAILLGAWGTSGPGDLDGDGVVGASDLAILLGAWTG